MSEEHKIIEIIERDILSFDSVSRFPGIGLGGNIQKAMGRDVQNPGIKINEDDDGLTINCEIIVYFGVNIPQLCYDIQSKIKKDIEEDTGKTVKAINIRIEGIDKPRSEQPS